MTSIKEKADHVRQSTQTRNHHCHWPGCTKMVTPARWGCPAHWYKLPPSLRGAIWSTYRIGQENDGEPSREYVEVARRVREWILAQEQQKP